MQPAAVSTSQEKEKKKKTYAFHIKTQPLLRAVKAELFPQALARQAGQGGPDVKVWAGCTKQQQAICLRKNIHLCEDSQPQDRKKMVEVKNRDDSLRYCNNNLDSQHLQMDKVEKHFPLMLNEL